MRTIQHRSPITAFLKEKEAPHNRLKHSKKELRPIGGGGYYCEGLQLPYSTKGNGRITQKDLQFFRASPYASEWSGNIHESKLSDIHRPTLSRLPIGRLKNHKYKKSAYGGKKARLAPGKKRLPHRPNTADYMTRNNQHAPAQKDEKHKHPYLNITHEEDEKDKAHSI